MKMRFHLFGTALSRGRKILVVILGITILPLMSCGKYVKYTGYEVEDKEAFTFQCGPIQYIRSPNISRSRTIISGPPLAPIVPSPSEVAAYLQVNIKPSDSSESAMCPTVIANGKEFAPSEYHARTAACGYGLEGLELTEEPLMVSLENRVLNCRVEEAEYKYYEYGVYVPFAPLAD